MEIIKKNEPTRGPYRTFYESDKLHQAYIAVKEKKMSLRKAALAYGVPKSTLIDRINGRINIDVVKSGSAPLFSQEQEALFSRHIQTMAEIGYGYSRQETLNLASDYAINLGLRDRDHPLTDRWLYNFLGRWPELAVRKPRSLEVARAKCATKEAVNNYFNALNNILVKYHLVAKPHLIYNIDEKGLSHEHKPPNIVAGRYYKAQAVTSGRSKTVTVIGCVNGVGQQVPPYFIFPGARMLDNLMDGATPGSAGTVSQTGWSNTDVFATYMKDHFLKYLPPRSAEQPVLVLYDGHRSHVSLSLIEWAKSENIVLFVLPPHCSHLLQPLDVGCFGPFEIAWNAAVHHYMRASGGCLVTRHEVASLACKVYSSTLTPNNIQSAFRKSGIFPFNRDVVSDHQVAPSTTFRREADSTYSGLIQPTNNSTEEKTAEHFLEMRGGEILENVQKAAKKRNTLSKVVGGKSITEDDIVEEIRAHQQLYGKNQKSVNNKRLQKRSQQSPVPGPSGPAKKTKKVLETIESSDEDELCESDKCIVCKRFSPDKSKRPFILIVSWGKCDKCSGWVHLSFCTPVKVIRRGDTFLCPSCTAQ